MNDFTKEELIKLKNCINYLPISTSTQYVADCVVIIQKLNKMIDNYCEHKLLDYVGDVSGYDCKKCGKRFDYEYVGDDRHERIMAGEEE